MRNMVRIKIKSKAGTGRSHSLDCTMAEKDYYSLPPLPYSTTELIPTGHEESLNSRAHIIKFNGSPSSNLYADCKEPVYGAAQLPFKAHHAAPEAKPNVYAESSLDLFCLPPIELRGRQRLNPYADYKEPSCSASALPVFPSLTTSNYPSRPEIDFSAHEVSLDSSAHSTSSLATEGQKEFEEYNKANNLPAQPTSTLSAMGFTQTNIRWNQHGGMNKWDDYQLTGMQMQGPQQLQHQQVIEPIPIVSNHDNIINGRSHFDTTATAPLSFTDDDVPSDEFACYIEEAIQTL